MHLPQALVRAVAAAGDPRRTARLDAPPAVVADLAALRSLEPGPPFQPGGHTARVAAAGPDRVLEIGWRHPEDEHEADGLRAWTGADAA